MFLNTFSLFLCLFVFSHFCQLRQFRRASKAHAHHMSEEEKKKRKKSAKKVQNRLFCPKKRKKSAKKVEIRLFSPNNENNK